MPPASRAGGFSALPLGLAAGAAIIVVAAFTVYIPCLGGQFVLDDDTLLTENRVIQSEDGLYRSWCSSESADFWPVTSTTFWIEWRLWGDSPGGYHVSNVILHSIEALLVWVILRKLSIPGAFFAALIFAVHPVNVESVAWIAQRKNMMAMLFFLLSVFWYMKALRSHGGPREREHNGGPWEREEWCPLAAKQTPHPSSFIPHPSSFYLLSLAAFVLAMLGKGSAAVLPVLILGIVWWMRPLTWRDLLRALPFFAVAVALTAVNVWFQTHGAEIVTRKADFVERLLGAGGVVWFYLYKAVFPIELAFVYRQWHIAAGDPLWWIPLLSALGVTAVLWRYRRSWARPLLFAWAMFCAALVPVMGFTDVGFMKYSLVADHYQHIAIIAAIALAASSWSGWRGRERGAGRWAGGLTAGAAVGLLALLAFRQSTIYGGGITLYRATLQRNPDCWMARNNLGQLLYRSGRVEEAGEQLEEALRLKPDYAEAHSNLGNLLSEIGRLPEAIEHYEKAIEINPNYAEAYNNLGNALTNSGRGGEAIERFERALTRRPDYPSAHNNLAAALAQLGRVQEALDHYGEAIRLKQNYTETHNNLGGLLSETGHLEEAIAHHRRALSIKPDYAEAHSDLGNALTKQGSTAEAVAEFERALKLKPDFAEAHSNLGVILVQAGKLSEAAEHFRHAVRLKPGYLEAQINLVVVHERLNQMPEAIAAAQKALEIARAQGRAEQAANIEAWLRLHGQ